MRSVQRPSFVPSPFSSCRRLRRGATDAATGPGPGRPRRHPFVRRSSLFSGSQRARGSGMPARAAARGRRERDPDIAVDAERRCDGVGVGVRDEPVAAAHDANQSRCTKWMETSPAKEAAEALGDIGNAAVPGLLQSLAHSDWKTRKFAALASEKLTRSRSSRR